MAAPFVMAAALSAGCAIVGYNFDGYGPPGASTEASGTSGAGGAGGANSGASSGGAGTGGSPQACLSPADCGLSGACQEPTCEGGVCGVHNLPATTACSNGEFCNGAGQCGVCMSATECGANTACLTFACTGGVCSSQPAPPSTSCIDSTGLVGICDGMGKCVQCLMDALCPAPGNQCQRAACNNGVCGVANKTVGEFCNTFADQCDGEGNCVDCVDNGGCGECCVCQNRVCIQAP
jgi:hypothetical protein